MHTKQKMRLRARYRTGAAALALIAAAAAPAQAQTGGGLVEFDIPAKELAGALKDYGVATDQQVIYPADLVRGKQAPAITGAVESGEALHRLLKDTGLGYERTGAQVIVIRPVLQKAMFVQDPERGDRAQEVETTVRGAEREGREAPRPRDEMTVTGTRIKGIAPESSPVQVYNREDIVESGVTTTEQFIRQLVQNSGNGSTEFVGPMGLPNDSNSQRNLSFGTGANLRGLGSGATLSLLNGMRVAPSSSIGDFVDLSMIPVSALERIEVLSDGASSIYGGDAVAGVINFVLRKDFEGAETALRYGTVTKGNMDEYRISQTAGAAWQSGSVIGTYEFFDRDNLRLSDRPAIPVPTVPSGGAITNPDQFDLLPRQRRHSGILSVRQEVNPSLELFSTGLYSNRSASITTVNTGASIPSVANDRAESEALALNLGGDYSFAPNWSVSVNGVYSRVWSDTSAQSLAPTLTEPSFAYSRSGLWSVEAIANGDLFALPAGRIKIAAGAQYREEDIRSGNRGSDPARLADRDVFSAFAELFIPIFSETNAQAGLQRLELNVSGRLDDYSDFGTTLNPKVGVLWSPIEGLNLRGSYNTSFAPPPLGRVGAMDRTVGVVSYPFIRNLLGIPLADPSLEDVNYLTISGTAENLEPESSRTYTAGADYYFERGDHTFSVRTTYYDIDFEGRLGATPMPQNINANFAAHLAFNDPSLFPPDTVIFFPTDEQVSAVVNSASIPLRFIGGPTAVDNIGFITNVLLIRNLARTKTKGLDAQFNYAVESPLGRIQTGLAANYVFEFKRQAAVTTPIVDALNTLYNPVGLKLRGNLSFGRGPFHTALFVNYTDGYKTDTTDQALPIDSWTTLDLTAAYTVQTGGGWLRGTSFNLSISNLLDANPPVTPTHNAFRLTGYDPANASPVGRFVAFEIRKKF